VERGDCSNQPKAQEAGTRPATSKGRIQSLQTRVPTVSVIKSIGQLIPQ
jgi:hypothetical protein